MPTYHVNEEHSEDSLEARQLQDAIDNYNMDVTGERDFWPVTLCLRDEAGRLCGGLSGGVWARWLHIKVLWLDEAARGGGYGSELLRAAERYARGRGARHVHVSSFSFQALAFYVKHGYEPFGTLTDYPLRETHVFLRKDL
jgi:GNAT superfamily N-acetyltransferase